MPVTRSEPQRDRPDDPGLGCYGLRLTGIPGAADQLGEPEPDAPLLHVHRAPAAEDLRPYLSERTACVPMSDHGSWAMLDRHAATATLHLCADYADEALVHPLLSGTCAIVNWWHGRDAFHAGAFDVDGRAWAVIGDKGQGKSTLLADLAGRGVPVLSDDLVVVDGGDVLPGPAFVDLRPDAAERLGVGRDMGVLGARPRFRLDVPKTRRGPHAGWVVLRWGERLRLRRLPVPERLAVLFANRAVLTAPASPASFTRFAALPCYELERPKEWSVRDEVAGLLSSQLTG